MRGLCRCGRLGAKTALITHKISTIGEMSCNPAIGGLGKGHLVREIDALDGLMAGVIDKAGIQFRMLNASKGPAVRGPRAQADRELYKKYMLEALRRQNNLELIEAAVEGMIIANNTVQGVGFGGRMPDNRQNGRSHFRNFPERCHVYWSPNQYRWPHWGCVM